ncbi:MAG TPA: hypothetical protein VGX76_11485, partial [Pirellulales bacterium]|nr:hypothetical protein [Pirellulales bacterium]
MPNAEKIIAAVEQSNLVTDDVVALLRKKIARTPAMGLREAVKWLVEKRHITTAQGGRLVAGAEKAEDDAEDEELNFAASNREIATSQTRGAPGADDDEMALFPSDGANGGEKPAAAKPAAAAGASARWAGTPGSTKSKTSSAKEPPVRSGARGSTAGARRRADEPKAAAPEPAADAGDDGMGDLFGATGLEDAAMEANNDALAPERKRPKPVRKQEDFGSTLMMTLAGSLLVVIAIGVGVLYASGLQNAHKKYNAA